MKPALFRSFAALTAPILGIGMLVAATPSASALDSFAHGDSGTNTIKLRMYNGVDGAGATWTEYLPNCSSSTSDTDYAMSTLDLSANFPGAPNWNNKAESWRDYNGCDVKFFTGESYGGTASAWQNSGGALVNMSSTYANNVESFKLS